MANDALFVSTDRGAIHCFGKTRSGSSASAVLRPDNSLQEGSAFAAESAKTILAHTRITQGLRAGSLAAGTVD